MNALSFKNRSRRKFLRDMSLSTAAVATGFGLASCAKSQPEQPASNTPPPNGQKKLGVALLGLGHYATNELAPAFQQTNLCELRGVVTGHPDKAAQWAQQYSLPPKNIYNYDNFDR